MIRRVRASHPLDVMSWGLCLTVALLTMGLFLPREVAGEPDLRTLWATEAEANGDPVTERAFLEHQARIGDPRPLIRATWPEGPEFAVAVARCETGGFVADVVFGRRLGWAANEAGVFQLHPGFWVPLARAHGYTWQQVQRDPVANIEVARAIYDRAGGWGPWSCSRLVSA